MTTFTKKLPVFVFILSGIAITTLQSQKLTEKSLHNNPNLNARRVHPNVQKNKLNAAYSWWVTFKSYVNAIEFNAKKYGKSEDSATKKAQKALMLLAVDKVRLPLLFYISSYLDTGNPDEKHLNQMLAHITLSNGDMIYKDGTRITKDIAQQFINKTIEDMLARLAQKNELANPNKPKKVVRFAQEPPKIRYIPAQGNMQKTPRIKGRERD